MQVLLVLVVVWCFEWAVAFFPFLPIIVTFYVIPLKHYAFFVTYKSSAIVPPTSSLPSQLDSIFHAPFALFIITGSLSYIIQDVTFFTFTFEHSISQCVLS